MRAFFVVLKRIVVIEIVLTPTVSPLASYLFLRYQEKSNQKEGGPGVY
jgi:hypothetical protein